MTISETLFIASWFIWIFLFIIWLINKNNDVLKKYMSFSAAIWALNMYLNWQLSWALINVINFVRNYFAIGSINFSRRRKYSLVASYFVFYVIIWYLLQQNYWYIPVVWSTIGLIALFLTKWLTSRLFLIFWTLTWLLYAILNSNIFGIVLEIIVFTTMMYSLFKNKFTFEN